MFKKGQIDAMAFTVLAVSLLIGVYLIGNIYEGIDQTSLPASVTGAMDDTLDNGTVGMTLMAVGLIVMAAMAILGIMGSRN